MKGRLQALLIAAPVALLVVGCGSTVSTPYQPTYMSRSDISAETQKVVACVGLGIDHGDRVEPAGARPSCIRFELGNIEFNSVPVSAGAALTTWHSAAEVLANCVQLDAAECQTEIAAMRLAGQGLAAAVP